MAFAVLKIVPLPLTFNNLFDLSTFLPVYRVSRLYLRVTILMSVFSPKTQLSVFSAQISPQHTGLGVTRISVVKDLNDKNLLIRDLLVQILDFAS